MYINQIGILPILKGKFWRNDKKETIPKNSILRHARGNIRMLKTAGKLAPEAKPMVVNLLFQAFFVYSQVAYTIFPHTFSEKWHLRQDRREGMCHFCLGYEKKIVNDLVKPFILRFKLRNCLLPCRILAYNSIQFSHIGATHTYTKKQIFAHIYSHTKTWWPFLTWFDLRIFNS